MEGAITKVVGQTLKLLYYAICIVFAWNLPYTYIYCPICYGRPGQEVRLDEHYNQSKRARIQSWYSSSITLHKMFLSLLVTHCGSKASKQYYLEFIAAFGYIRRLFYQNPKY